jgi:hypothetical protein
MPLPSLVAYFVLPILLLLAANVLPLPLWAKFQENSKKIPRRAVSGLAVVSENLLLVCIDKKC